jgi:hypothetical protein
MTRFRELFIVCFLILASWLAVPNSAQAAISCVSVDAQHTVNLNLAESNYSNMSMYRPNEPILFHVSSLIEGATLSWIINDKPVPDTKGSDLCFMFDRSGTQKVTVTESSGKKSISFDLTTASYTNITLVKLLPNPVGPDTNSEEIYLANGNSYPVTLVNWQLKSKTTKTAQPINLTINAGSEAVVKASNKLRNEDGEYELYNESGVLVDSVSYPSTQEGVYITRVNGAWVIPQKDKTTKTAKESTTTASVAATGETTVFLEGVVILPEGRTFDIETKDGKTVHVVIHTSFTGDKPKFHKGDQVKVTGVWKSSANGQYLSVRAGDTLTVVSSATTTKQAESSGKKATLDTSGLADIAALSSTESAKAASRTISSPRSIESTVLSSDQSLRWLFIIMVTVGVLLALPYRPQSPV